MLPIELNPQQQAFLNGTHGPAKQMAMRLIVDLAAAAGAAGLVPIHSAHLSGVSPLTGGLGLHRFLERLAADPQAQVVVPATLNAAGCDAAQFEAMRIAVPNFREDSQSIVELYSRLGVRPTQSCIPYEWEGVVAIGTAAWSESNAICYGNSYSGLRTNRESGLSALAAALTGTTPDYGLLADDARRPNLEVMVTARLDDPTDFSVLGDWIGRQRQPHWRQPFGPIPLIRGLEGSNLTHEQRKALSAAAANYGCALLYIEGLGDVLPDDFQDTLTFTAADLATRYAELRPGAPVSLVVIGCPQASVGEIRATAALLQGKQVAVEPGADSDRVPLWLFTSAANKTIAERAGLADVIRASGALLLENTCPEVVPYDPTWVKHILTNSMKAEHYLKSGLNRIPASVARLADCVAVATGELAISRQPSGGQLVGHVSNVTPPPSTGHVSNAMPSAISGHFTACGHGLPSQDDFTITGRAFVTDAPITFLGFVNRETGVIEEPGHPADGQSMAGRIAIFPRGVGSTVAPYVLLELYYRGVAPLAIVNSQIDQQCAPACSLEGIPYAYGFDADVTAGIQHGDVVQLRRRGEEVTIRVRNSEFGTRYAG